MLTKENLQKNREWYQIDPSSMTGDGESLAGNDIGECVCTFIGCGKLFNSKWSMTRHLRTHTGDKPFKCTAPGCKKEFVEKCALKRHEQTHAKAKSWVCDHPGCEKKFKLKEYLDVHKRTHAPDHHAQKASRTSMNDYVLQPTPFNAEQPIDDAEHRVVVDQLKGRLVRMSVRHHEELSSQLKESEWLKQSLLECSNALHESISLLRAQEAAIMQYKHTLNIRESMGDKIASSGVSHSNNVLLSSLFKAVPSSLTETAAKFNIENISAACKSSVGPPSNGEQLSFLSKVKAAPTETRTTTDSTACCPAEPVEDISATKGGTMTLIESLMNSALNADRVLTKIVSGAQPMMQPNGFEFGEIAQQKDQSPTPTDVESGSDKEADVSGSSTSSSSTTSAEPTPVAQSHPTPVALALPESLYFKLPSEVQSESVTNKTLPFSTSNTNPGDYTQPPFFKYLQKNNDGSFGLNTDNNTAPAEHGVVVGMGTNNDDCEMDSPLGILSAVSAVTASSHDHTELVSNLEKRRRLE